MEKGIIFEDAEEMVQVIERDTNYDVLNVGNYSMDVMDRSGWDSKVRTIKIIREENSISLEEDLK